MTAPTILIIEDDTTLNKLLVEELNQSGFNVFGSETWAEAKTMIDQLAPELVLLDVKLPDANGLDLLADITASRPVVMLTATASVNQAVEAVKRGAADYLAKPVNLNELELIIRRALKNRQLFAEHEYRRNEESVRLGGMLGDSDAMVELKQLIKAVGQTEVTVLIQGESGSGKELVAHAVHHESPRREGAFVTVDCCSLQDTLFESELFGHEKGSFTGADRRKFGLIEAAKGGTLFLDEIGEIGPAIQAKLLRVLETARFRRVGGTNDLRADARIVAATNRDLAAMVRAGSFRADLYYRLDAFTINVPSLRERRGDIPILANNFLSKNISRGRYRLHPDSIEILKKYDWPGNVRELRNVIERAIIIAGSSSEILPVHLHGLSAGTRTNASFAEAEIIRLEDEPTLEHIEREYMALLLDKYQGNFRIVAKKLGVSERTCYRMADRYKLR